MTSTLYTDEIKSIDDSQIVNLNGVKIVYTNDVQTDYVLRATDTNQASWVDFSGNPAPINSEYIDLALYGPPLTNDRNFVAGLGIATTDNGAKSTFIIDTTATTTQTGRFYQPTITVDSTGRVVDIENGRSMVLPVDIATLQNGTLATAFVNGATIDGIVITTGNRILIKDQTNQTENGIYIVNNSGAPTRDRDFENLFGTSSPIQGYMVSVRNGVLNRGNTYICLNVPPINIGVDAIRFQILSGMSTRAKLLTPDDFPNVEINIGARSLSGSLAGAHFDIQSGDDLDGNAPIVNNITVPLSIDGKMSGIDFVQASDVITFENISGLVLKNINFVKTGVAGSIIQFDGCSDILISGCVFNYLDTALDFDTCGRIIIKDCVFLGTGSGNSNALTFNNLSVDIICVGNQFRNIVLSDNSIESCILSETDGGTIITGNTFDNTGRAIDLAGIASIATHNALVNPAPNPSGTINMNVIGANVKFGYINLAGILSIANCNSWNFGPTAITGGQNFTGIVSRTTAGSCCINGNALRGFPGGIAQNGIAWEEQSSDNVSIDNSYSVATAFGASTTSALICGIADDCLTGFVGYNEAVRGQTNISGTLGTLITTSGNTYIKAVKGGVADLNNDILVFTIDIRSLMDIFLFNINSAGTLAGTYNGFPPIGSHGYRSVFRKDITLPGGGGQVDLTIANFTAGTGIRFPGAVSSSAVIEWTGYDWVVISLQNGAVVF